MFSGKRQEKYNQQNQTYKKLIKQRNLVVFQQMTTNSNAGTQNSSIRPEKKKPRQKSQIQIQAKTQTQVTKNTDNTQTNQGAINVQCNELEDIIQNYAEDHVNMKITQDYKNIINLMIIISPSTSEISYLRIIVKNSGKKYNL
ncbi:Hypothetical_protein [Hexamita inflata]|uniref:Hypothetical_protein n=1 Tax=Hexamita inflata TaxID=28002 RepID=A0ABP1I227_9EUKA